MEKQHSKECIELNISNIKKEIKKIKDKKDFIKSCKDILNNSSIYDRFKNTFKNIYNQKIYNFPLYDNMLSNIINKQKNNSNKFKKECVTYNMYDYQNRQFLREYRNIYINVPKKRTNFTFLIILGIDENIQKIRISKNLFIDRILHHLPEYKQILIVMYKDSLINLKIPYFYKLINGKYEIFCKIVIETIFKIINDNNKYNFQYQIIVTDREQALINEIKKFFFKIQRISCYFHYKQDFIKNIRIYKLYKKKE